MPSLLGMAAVAAVAQARKQAGEQAEGAAPLACALSPDAYSSRMTEIETLFGQSTETRELADGYAFRFPGDGDHATLLMDFIKQERHCCSFFRFELVFEPEHGPIWLHLRGSDEIKAFLAGVLQQTER